MRWTILLLTAAAFPAQAAQPVTGTWLTDTKDGLIEIGQCGSRLCGRLAKTLVPVKGPGTDINNPDARLRSRPIVGLPILTGFVDDGALWRGTAYDPKNGKSYRSTLQRTGPNTLKLTGCVAIFCRSVTWTRAK
ncbi:DUF2147 domain-containing protein [Sphingomonas sp. ID1715]|uniref:DUF2147 domain-containing protein n=1 Tax=Sphingomonas sp. ID1715 TaxID=1656898 RepID=UPI001488529C|nr:DUF2147 domain-containing protein [Sphingomonas sp. ID1715]NNM76213.1 DUF2147 domain-containing protein [Sphingomonas sp. ID1715]